MALYNHKLGQILRKYFVNPTHRNILQAQKLFEKSSSLKFNNDAISDNLNKCVLKKKNQGCDLTILARNQCSHRNSPEKCQENSTSNLESKSNELSNIGEGTWQEVYRGVLTAQFKLLKMFSFGTSVICLSVQPILLEKLGGANLALVATLASFLGFFTFLTPALIHWVTKKYVTKLEYDEKRDVYAATTLSFFLKEKKIHFKVDDVITPDIPGMFTSFKVKDQPLFVDPHMFEDIDHYSRIMGLDKPIDFRNDEKKPR